VERKDCRTGAEQRERRARVRDVWKGDESTKQEERQNEAGTRRDVGARQAKKTRRHARGEIGDAITGEER
jgi:hypothetical protein